MFHKYQKAFTLVELIVVITILAILGTIWFISLQWYSLSARDSARISDLNTIAQWLEYHKLQEWVYPFPTDSYDITFSGSLAWKQGVFWQETQTILQNISQVPLDPLTQNPYAYSVTNTRQEYELWSITEGLVFSINNVNSWDSLIPHKTTYANNSFFTYIKWNYNRKIVTVQQEDSMYILWVPTLITTEIVSVDVRDVLINQSFAISWEKNLPASYISTLPEGQSHTWSISFEAGPVLDAPILYEWTVQELSGSDAKQILWENLVSYYAQSNLSNTPAYSDIQDISDWEEYQYINRLVQWDVGGLSSNSVVESLETPMSLTGWWGTSYPDSCLDMTSSHLANLNSWMQVNLWLDWFWNPSWYAELTIGTSNLTVEEWCSINFIESYGDPFSWQVTYMPEEFWFLENLEIVYFQDHDLQALPETLILLENLTEIDFYGNTSLWDISQQVFEWQGDWFVCEENISTLWNTMCINFIPWDFTDSFQFSIWWVIPNGFTWWDIPFISIWQSDNVWDSNDNQITIPVWLGTNYDFDITWYNTNTPAISGTLIDVNTETVITFPSAGLYTVEITGQYPHMYMDDFYGDAAKIVSVNQWWNVGWESMQRMFHRASNLTSVPTNTTWLENVENMSLVFSATDSFNQDISAWDVSWVTNMTGMFQNNPVFNQDISWWSVDGVTQCFIFSGWWNANASWLTWDKPVFNNCTPWY